ncbi:hypothetical protein ACFL47_05390 [Candidatus Latescibacterota bacterium]
MDEIEIEDCSDEDLLQGVTIDSAIEVQRAVRLDHTAPEQTEHRYLTLHFEVPPCLRDIL